MESSFFLSFLLTRDISDANIYERMGVGSKLTFVKFKEVTGRRKEGTVKKGIHCGAEDRCRLRSFADKIRRLTSFLILCVILGKSFYRKLRQPSSKMGQKYLLWKAYLKTQWLTSVRGRAHRGC